ncbi:MAG TPA: hypothetical protein DD670_09305 [Planctomycetaceae bacterium]|nr:hypothetical protein [Planctomycetaceae bacterium]
MPTYRYTCDVDASLGEPADGTIEAADRADALRQLSARGLDPHRIALSDVAPDATAVGEAPGQSPSNETLVELPDMIAGHEHTLNGPEAESVVVGLSDLVASGLPLPEGLYALADELGLGRSADALRHLARQIEAGHSPADALQSAGGGLPEHLQGLIEAGMASGQLGGVLEEYVDLQREQSELRRRMWLAVTYPLVLLGFAFALLIGFGIFICPPFRDIFDDFGTNLPPMTEAVFWVFGSGLWWFLAAVALVAGLFLFALLGPAPLWMRLCVYRVPVFGPFWRYSRLTPFARLMAMFVEQNTPLPDALRWTAAGLSDRHLIAGCHEAAEYVEAGESLADALAASNAFPESLFPLLNWGGRFGSLSAAFRFIAESVRNRTHLQTDLARLVVLPAATLVIGVAAVIMISLFLPLMNLIETLS